MPIFGRGFVLSCSCLVRSFFFSSRRRHTRCLSDWSSDVCSSDLPLRETPEYLVGETDIAFEQHVVQLSLVFLEFVDVAFQEVQLARIEVLEKTFEEPARNLVVDHGRSEERRVGKECRYGGSRYE